MESIDSILARFGHEKRSIRIRVYQHPNNEREFYIRRNVERYQQENFTGIGVGALVFHPSGDGRMLFVKEKRLVKGKEKDLWATPGGGAVEEDKLAEDALQREVREETGIEIEIGDLHLVDRVIGTDQKGEILYDFYFLTFDARALTEETHPQDSKTIEVAWMKKLPEGLLLRKDYELILKRRKKKDLSND
ncbi:MAG: NUDIX hydrolase [Candidatus Thorarchaeota archaeon]